MAESGSDSRMTFWEEIKALFTIKGVLEEEIKEAKMNTASGKPGWKTSEFWLNAAAQAGVVWASLKGFIPPQWAAIITIAGTAVYTIARTIAKAISDIQAAKSGAAPTA